jgi:hypothetical protein
MQTKEDVAMQVIHYASLYKAQNGRTLKRKSKSAQQRG